MELFMPCTCLRTPKKMDEKQASKRGAKRERGIYIALIETKLPKPSPSSPPKFAPFRVLS